MNTDVEKSRFVEEFGDDYGYPNAPKNIDEIRATEFSRLKGSNKQYSINLDCYIYSHLIVYGVRLLSCFRIHAGSKWFPILELWVFQY